LEALTAGKEMSGTMTLVIICPECLAELKQIIDRAELGDAAAQVSLRGERARLSKTVAEAVTDD
jgi:hypothetical protein